MFEKTCQLHKNDRSKRNDETNILLKLHNINVKQIYYVQRRSAIYIPLSGRFKMNNIILE